MNIVVLGHTGFIGRKIYENIGNTFPGVEVKGFSSHEVNLLDFSGIEQLLENINSDTVVIMCAAIKKQLGDSLDIFSHNMRMLENLCTALGSLIFKQLVYISSTAVYGEDIQNLSINESTALNPRSFYGISKSSAEYLLQKVFSEREHTSLAILRPPLIYGEGDTSRGYGPTGFIHKVVAREDILLWGEGDELREFVFIDDFLTLVSAVVAKQYRGTLNAVSGRSYSFLDVIDAIKKVHEPNINVVTRARSKDKVDHVFIAQALFELMPDFAFTPLEQGVAQTYSEVLKSVEKT